MYFKVDRKVLKKALVWLKNQPKTHLVFNTDKSGNTTSYETYSISTNEYISKIEFALYKTKMEEFYIDYDFAQAIRPALLTKKVTKRD